MSNGLINELLNDDCLLEIFSYLNISDLRDAQKVCRRWDALWPRLWRTVSILNCKQYMWSFAKKNFSGNLVVNSTNELKEMLEYCGPFIRQFYLDVHDNDSVEFSALITTVIDHCKYIEDVSINIVDPPSMYRIDKILRNCSNMKKLAISNMSHNEEESLSILRINNIKLKGFSLSGVTAWNVSGKFFEYLPDDLEELELIECFNNTDSSHAISAFIRFNNLRSFRCDECTWFGDSLAKIVCEKTKLVKLEIPSSFKLSSSFDGLINLANLQVLDLEDNSKLTDTNLTNIVNYCKQIEELNLTSCIRLTNVGISSIGKLQKLRSLSIGRLRHITDESFGDLPNTLVDFACEKCKRVKDPGLMKLLKKAENLRSLNIIGCPSVTLEFYGAVRTISESRKRNIRLDVCYRSTIIDPPMIWRQIPKPARLRPR